MGGTTLTLTGAGTITTEADGVMKAPLGGKAGLTKQGKASLTLGGINTYTGDTEISGTLAPSGTLSFGADLNFNKALGFSWDITADSTDPGANAINRGTYDSVSAASLSGRGAVFHIVNAGSFMDAFWDTNKSWDNIFNGASFAKIFSSFSGTGVSPDGVVAGIGSFAISRSTLTFTAIPEPNSGLAGLLLAAGIFQRRR